MTSEVKNLVEELILELRSENLPLEQVYLFGAYSSGRQNDHSRIDVAVVLSEFEDDDIDQTQRFLNKLKRKINFRMEIYPFEASNFNLDDPFAAEIIKTGIQIL